MQQIFSAYPPYVCYAKTFIHSFNKYLMSFYNVRDTVMVWGFGPCGTYVPVVEYTEQERQLWNLQSMGKETINYATHSKQGQHSLG